MGKKKGDPKRLAVRSISEISHDLATSVAKRDARYNYFVNYVPVPVLMKEDGFFRSKKKTCAACGGNKSTKTTAGVFKTIMIYTGIIPDSMVGVYAHEETLRDIGPGGPNQRPRQARIIVQSYSKHWPETIRPLLLGDPASGGLGMLPEAWSDWDEEERMFHGPDGSYLSIVSIDPHEKVDPNILRGPLIDHTMVDEINAQAVYTESLTRGVSLKNGPRTVDLTYCPQEGYECWTFDLIYKAGYDPVTDLELPKEKKHPAISITRVTMRDNPSITEEERAAIVSTCKPWEVAFRVDGKYSQRAANPFFDMMTMIEWEQEERCSDGVPHKVVPTKVNEEQGLFQGTLVEVPDQPDRPGEAIWYVWDKPRDGHRYVIACDIAEGHPDSDPHAIGVWDATVPAMPKEVAQYRGRNIKPGALAVETALVGNYYAGGGHRYTLMVPEKNNTGGGMFIERVRTYQNMYTRIRGGKKREKQTEDLGWYTDRSTKGPMLSDAYKMFHEMRAMEITVDGKTQNFCPLNSVLTLHELMGYEERILRKRDNVATVEWGSRPGAHDDTVMQLVIAFRIIRHEYGKLTPCKLEGRRVPYAHQLREAEDGGVKSKTSRKAFQGMRRQKSLTELRRQHGRRI